MPVLRIDADKENHAEEPMQFNIKVDGDCSAVCGECDGYVLLTDEEAGSGIVHCSGNIIVVSWSGA
jgi:hypothetical protein